MSALSDRATRDLARSRGVDLSSPLLLMRLAAERLSIIRYVFLVQIEEGIASADQRAALEYADAVLMGWPQGESGSVVELDEDAEGHAHGLASLMEGHVSRFRDLERDGDVPGMTRCLVSVTEQVAGIRSLYQPGFELPTFEEIQRVVQKEWDDDMGRIETSDQAESVDRKLERDVRGSISGKDSADSTRTDRA